MHDPLPPDLARLGDQLGAATARARARRHRRLLLGRFGATGAAAAIALAMFAPGALQSTDGPRSFAAAAASTVYRPVACDQPRGATFAAARPCAAPGTTDATPGGLARRLAYH
jgi:hypothetical protein